MTQNIGNGMRRIARMISIDTVSNYEEDEKT
jgi:hypothetical protein